MDLSEVLDRSRELVRSRGLEPAIAAVQAVDELAEGFSEPIDEVLFGIDSYLICKNSRAKSYLVPKLLLFFIGGVDG